MNIMTHFDKIKSRMVEKTYWDISAGQSIHHWCRFCKALPPWCGMPHTCIRLFHYGCTDFSWCTWCLHPQEVVESDSLQALQECRQWHCKFSKLLYTVQYVLYKTHVIRESLFHYNGKGGILFYLGLNCKTANNFR